jgi:hypothetical protein
MFHAYLIRPSYLSISINYELIKILGYLHTYVLNIINCVIFPGVVAQSTLHPPQEQKTIVRIPPGYKVV